MLNEIELNNLRKVNEILDEFRTSMSNAEKELKGIDEKYKVIIAKEKESYKQTIASCKKEIEFWEKPFLKRYGKPISELLEKPEDASEADEKSADESDELPFSTDEDEKVVDKEVETAPVEDLPTKEQTEEVAAEETVSEESVAEAKEEANDDWEEKTEAEAQEDNDGWGTDFPDEWK